MGTLTHVYSVPPQRELPQSAQTADLRSRSVFLFLSAFVLFLAPPELVVGRTIIIKFITMSRWPPPYQNQTQKPLS